MPNFTAAQQGWSAMITGAGMPSLEADAVISAIVALAQNGSSVAITGGTIDGTAIGGTTKAAGGFTTLTASSTTILLGGVTAAFDGNANRLTYGNTGTIAIDQGRFSNDAGGPNFRGWKSRGTTLNSNGQLSLNDFLLQLTGHGNDGSAFVACANIAFNVDGAVSTGIVPTRIVLSTTNLAGALTTALTIDSVQASTFAGVVKVPGAANPVLTTTSAVTSGAAANTGTLTNAPAAGNPTKWVPFNDNGTTRYFPVW